VNFSPFEGRGDANGDRPERAESCPLPVARERQLAARSGPWSRHQQTVAKGGKGTFCTWFLNL